MTKEKVPNVPGWPVQKLFVITIVAMLAGVFFYKISKELSINDLQVIVGVMFAALTGLMLYRITTP